MLLFQPGGPLQDFRYINPENFHFPDPIDNGKLSEALGLTEDLANDLYLPDTADDVRQAMHELATWVAFSGSVFSSDGKMTFSSDFLEFQQMEDQDEDDEDDSTECPSGKFIPFCGNCGGDTTSASNGMQQGECKGVGRRKIGKGKLH